MFNTKYNKLRDLILYNLSQGRTNKLLIYHIYLKYFPS